MIKTTNNETTITTMFGANYAESMNFGTRRVHDIDADVNSAKASEKVESNSARLESITRNHTQTCVQHL
eukprot:3092821-Karenia_brevis.AAC.1